MKQGGFPTMWLCFSDAFFSVVDRGSSEFLLVRSRQDGAIERYFGRKPEKKLSSDYKWHCMIRRVDLATVLARQCDRIEYKNFKDSVSDPELHHAYERCWSALAATQHPGPWSQRAALPTTGDEQPRHRRQQPMPKQGAAIVPAQH
jgi:hypothetical protein